MPRITTCTWQEGLRRNWQSPAHLRWDGKSHRVLGPQDRHRGLDGPLRRSLGRILREWCPPQRVDLVEGQALPAHGPRCLRLPPTYRVAHTGDWLKGTAASRLHRAGGGRARHGTGLPVGARGEGVSPVGRDEQGLRDAIRHQAQEEQRQEERQRQGREALS